MAGRVIRFPQKAPPDGDRSGARCVLDLQPEDRLVRAVELALDEPDMLLSLSASVRDLLEHSPVLARSEAEFFFRYVRSPERAIGLFDERDYFLGEFALIAGTACRQLSLGDDARLWFDRAESAFRHSVNAVSDLARLAYQRLALRTADREMETVLEMAPALSRSFRALGMREDELKARFLEGLAFMETNRLDEAANLYEDVCQVATEIHADGLLAQAHGNLAQIYARMGDSRKAIEASERAVPLLQAVGNRIGLAKANWGIAVLLRETGQLDLSIDAYSTAQAQFEEIGMRADVAALHLVIADMRLEQGRENEALRSVLAALPVIDELEMVPEGMAAMALLRESVSRKRINQKALREVHGYFDELNGR